MAAKMQCAYYDHSCDSRALFADLAIAGDESFEQHLNKYPVIYLDMSGFVSRYKCEDIITMLTERIKGDVIKSFPEIGTATDSQSGLIDCLLHITEAMGQKFVFIIDEWDAILREYEASSVVKDQYIDWLRQLFKDTLGYRVFTGAYLTGILPIKKYNTQSALINMNYEGLKDDIVAMLGSEQRIVDTDSFGNDISLVKSKDDVLTLLIHLGFLSYDSNEGKCYIPNHEVETELVRAVKQNNWVEVV